MVLAAVLPIFATVLAPELAAARNGGGFVENEGQVDPSVLYYARLGTTTAYFTADGIVFDLRASLGEREEPNAIAQRRSLESSLDAPRPLHGHAVALRFSGHATTPSFEPGGQRETRLHYFTSSTEGSTSGVYDDLLVRDAWPGIDLAFSTDGSALVYEIRARAGADPSAVSFEWEGATTIRSEAGADEGSDLSRVETTAGTLLFSESALEGRVRVPANVPANPPAVRLGGDALRWSTFLGGTSDEIGWCVVLDSNEDVVVAGITLSVAFPTTLGAYDTSYNQFGDVFVAKLRGDGSALLWSTFLGGNGATYFDYGYAVTLDESDRPVVVGYTGSTNFPTTAGAYDRTHNGGVDVFVTKLAADGSSLLFSTFVGDVDHDIAYSVDMDQADNVVVSGRTLSPTFPTTSGAYDRFANGEEDGFVLKLSGNGQSLLWSTLVGGSLYDGADVVRMDSDDRPTVIGYTASFDFPTTGGVHDQDWNGGLYDGFALKLDGDAGSLLWSTYVGGSDTDFANALALDAADDLILVGETGSFDFPATPSAYDDSFNGADDAYVTKLSGTNGTLLWSTFLGGTVPIYETAFGVDIDALGGPVVVGTTPADDFPTVPGGYDTSHNGAQDVFIAQLDADGSALLASTFLGASGNDYAWFAGLASNGDVVVTGDTGSTDFPTTPGAFDTDYNGSDQDVWVARISLESSPASTPAPGVDAVLSVRVRPNPAFGSVQFAAPAALTGRMQVVDPAGRVVARFDVQDANQFAWDGLDESGRPAAAGVYVAMFDAGTHTTATRFVLVR